MPKISALTALAQGSVDPAADVVAVVDSSATETKKATVAALVAAGQKLIFSGTGSPEGVVTASVPALYIDITTPADPVLYFKTSGTGNTGWV